MIVNDFRFSNIGCSDWDFKFLDIDHSTSKLLDNDEKHYFLLEAPLISVGR